MKSDQVACGARAAQLRHREGRPAVQHNSGAFRDVPLYVGTFALLAQPPFHHTTACPTRPGGERTDAAIKRSKTRASRATGRRTTRCGLGVPHHGWREPPENWVVGCEASRSNEYATHDIGFQLSTIYTNTLQDLLYFNDEPFTRILERDRTTLNDTRTWMENRPSQLNMTEMPWALGHRLSTRLTLEVPVNRTHTGVHQTTEFWFVAGLIHDFGMFDLDDGVRFLMKSQGNF